jgi:ferredoxin
VQGIAPRASVAHLSRRAREVTMRAIVDRDLCIGCGLCADTCPEVFVILDDGYAHALGETVDPEQYDCVQEAAEICPVEAISTASD